MMSKNRLMALLCLLIPFLLVIILILIMYLQISGRQSNNHKRKIFEVLHILGNLNALNFKPDTARVKYKCICHQQVKINATMTHFHVLFCFHFLHVLLPIIIIVYDLYSIVLVGLLISLMKVAVCTETSDSRIYFVNYKQ